jgi:hypothetical protein
MFCLFALIFNDLRREHVKKAIAILLMTLAAPTTAGAVDCFPDISNGRAWELCQHQNDLERRIEKADREQRERLEELEWKQRQSEQHMYVRPPYWRSGKEREEEQE